VSGFVQELNTFNAPTDDISNPQKSLICEPTAFQSVFHSIHSYPFVTVIEKRVSPVSQFVSRRHGTDWKPFIK